MFSVSRSMRNYSIQAYEEQREAKTKRICVPLFRAAQQIGLESVTIDHIGTIVVQNNIDATIDDVLHVLNNRERNNPHVFRALQKKLEELGRAVKQIL